MKQRDMGGDMDTGFKIIAYVHTDFPAKFGIPRQSGLINSLKGTLCFEPEFRNPDVVRGLEEFSHIWLLWRCSESIRNTWSATVAPPRLGGRVKKGVFATRSPFRPNPIGLSSVRLERIVYDETLGPVLHISGADILDGTPVYDIKPYLAYTDSHPEARAGFADTVLGYGLEVSFPEALLQKLPKEQRDTVIELLRQDPRPGTKEAPDKEYRMLFGDYDIWFFVRNDQVQVSNVILKSREA